MPNKLRRPTTGCSARLTPHVDSLPGGSYHEAPTGSPTQAAINTFPKALGVAARIQDIRGTPRPGRPGHRRSRRATTCPMTCSSAAT